MSRNSSGTYTLPVGNPVVSGTVIEANWANTTNDDIAAALTDSLSRSGKGGMSASLRIIDGTVSVPGVAFGNETGSGAYRAAAGDWYLTVLGSNIARLRASGVDVTGALGVSGAATVGGTLGVTGVATLTANPVLSGGTVNGVPYLNASKELTSGTALTFSGSTLTTPLAKIGTGAAANSARLMINMPSGTAAGIQLFQDSQESWIMESVASSTALRWTSSGVERMRLESGGKLGIATASPYSNLDVGLTGADAVTSLFTTGVSDLNFRAGFSNGVSGSTGTLQARVGLFYLGSGEVATIGMYRGASATDGSLSIRTAGNDRLYVNSAGSVGIGTNSPAYKLDVAGDIGMKTNATYIVGKTSGGNTTRMLGINSSNEVYVGSVDQASGGVNIVTGAANSYANISASGVLSFNSGYGSVAAAYGCRAWVSFNGDTGAIRGSGGVSSISVLSTGSYGVNLTSALPDLNYCISGSGATGASSSVPMLDHSGIISRTTSRCPVATQLYDGTYINRTYINVAIFR